MKIGFYGHSNCAYRSEESFLDLFASALNAKIVNTGVRQGSEERILYELKKTRSLDLAVIFHSYPNYLFLPDCDRDFDLKSVINRHAEKIWESFEIAQISKGWDFHKKHHLKFIRKFKDINTFVDVIGKHKEYLYNPDLQMNRFYGALIQIDQYVSSKKIPTLHIVEKDYLPTWFKFTSGLEDSSIIEIIKNSKLGENDPWCANGITIQGNKLVAERLSELYAACSRQEYTNQPD